MLNQLPHTPQVSVPSAPLYMCCTGSETIALDSCIMSSRVPVQQVMGLAECSSSAHTHTRSWHLARDPLFKRLTACRELVHRQDEICEQICGTYALTPCNVLYANVSTTGQSSNMSNALLNSVSTLNSSNGAEWLPAMEAYLMSQGL